MRMPVTSPSPNRLTSAPTRSNIGSCVRARAAAVSRPRPSLSEWRNENWALLSRRKADVVAVAPERDALGLAGPAADLLDVAAGLVRRPDRHHGPMRDDEAQRRLQHEFRRRRGVVAVECRQPDRRQRCGIQRFGDRPFQPGRLGDERHFFKPLERPEEGREVDAVAHQARLARRIAADELARRVAEEALVDQAHGHRENRHQRRGQRGARVVLVDAQAPVRVGAAGRQQRRQAEMRLAQHGAGDGILQAFKRQHGGSS